jgi:hypothetical protein
MSVLAAFSLSSQTPVWLALAMRLKRPLVQLAVLAAVTMALLPLSQAQAGKPYTTTAQEHTVEHPTLAQQIEAQPVDAEASVFPEAGRYLFGQVPQRDQLGQGYIVLETTGNEVFGALYYPSSSFDCFQGQVQSGRLAMTVTNSYTQETYPYSIALVADTTVATPYPDVLEPLSLEGFHSITSITDNDLRLLNTCRAIVTPEG